MKHAVEGFDVVGAQAPRAYFATRDESTLGHAYIFTGPDGVGKKTFARRLAQSLFCERPKEGVLGYDGTCAACKSFVAGTHPDFYESDGVVTIGTDPGRARDGEQMQTRDLVRELSLRPYLGRWRVTLLGDVAFATDAAANAMLKLIEEPPSGVLFIFTTAAPDALLPTIRSRVTEIRFGPIAKEEIVAVLEREGVEPDRAAFAAAASLGSLGRAKALLDDAGSSARSSAIAWFAAAVAGRVPKNDFLQLDDRDVSAGEKRANVAEMLETVRAVARDWAAVTIAGDAVARLASDAREAIAKFPRRTPAGTVAALEAVDAAARLAETNVSAQLVVDFARMRLAPR